MTEASEGWKRTGRPRECRSTATWKRSWRKRSLGLMSDVFPPRKRVEENEEVEENGEKQKEG